MTGKTVTILLVEDDIVDVMAIKRSFRDLKIANPIVEAQDGIEALARLRGTDGYQAVPRPYLILLDLNMPRMGGLEFLSEIRRDPLLGRSIVFVLTTSTLDEDRILAYDKNVSGYVLKYKPGETFIEAINMLSAYWRVIEFPD